MLVDYFGKNNIFIGGAKKNPEAARKIFKIYPTGKEVGLNLVYPKPKKNELRLYLSSEAGFKPESGAILFIFVRDKDLWIGAFPESEWNDFNHSVINDDSDFIYQASLNESNILKRTTLKEREIYQRDREKALAAIDASGYQCENDSSHALFISHATKKPYLEAHHLIPMCLEELMGVQLDVLESKGSEPLILALAFRFVDAGIELTFYRLLGRCAG